MLSSLKGDAHESSFFFVSESKSTVARIDDNLKVKVLENCLWSVYGFLLRIAKTVDYEVQRAVYKGHKRKHSFMFQTIIAPSGLILLAHEPMTGSRRNRSLFIQPEMDKQLQKVCLHKMEQLCVYGDSSYYWIPYLDVPFVGSQLCAAQRAANNATSSVRVTVSGCIRRRKFIRPHQTLYES